MLVTEMTGSRGGFESEAIQLCLAAPQQTMPQVSGTSRWPISLAEHDG
jgi:hypothetical protein